MRLPTLSAPICLALAASASPASASGDGAWREFNARVTRACVVASGIRNARASTIVGFDDRVGTVAMLVSDRTRGSSASKLCLYDKRARRAHVDDAEMWSAPPQVR
jgi:hypothetical protein